MAAPTQEQRAKVNHELKRLGFGGLDDPTLMTQFAFFVRTHEQFRGILMSVKPDERRIAYEALAPRLKFGPKPLEVYEREMKEKAEREQLPIWDGSAYPKPFKVPEISLAQRAEEAIAQSMFEKQGGKLEMTCLTCNQTDHWWAKHRKQAVKMAYNAGWRWAERNGTTKHYCPQHVPGRLTMTLQCGKCEKVERLRAWDEQDGYAAARLRGWLIEEGATCPACSVKKLILQ